MSSAREYFDTLKGARDAVALLFGVDAATVPDDTRRVANGNLATVAVIAKQLVDRGVLTDSQLQTALNAAVSGADGSVWVDPTFPADDYYFLSDFDPEGFETGPNGAPVTGSNSMFAWGQVGDTLLSANASLTFDNSQHQLGFYSLKSFTKDGFSRALRFNHRYSGNQFCRFYFRAASAPPTSGCRIVASQRGQDPSTAGADFWLFEVTVDSTGKPTMVENGNALTPGTSPPSICDGNWWRVETNFNTEPGTFTTEMRLFGGANLTGTTPTFSYTGGYSGWGGTSVVLGQPRSALTSGQSWTCWFDDVEFNSGGTWLGP